MALGLPIIYLFRKFQNEVLYKRVKSLQKSWIFVHLILFSSHYTSFYGWNQKSQFWDIPTDQNFVPMNPSNFPNLGNFPTSSNTVKGWPDRQVAVFHSLYCPCLPTCQKVNVNMLVNKISSWINWWSGHPLKFLRFKFLPTAFPCHIRVIVSEPVCWLVMPVL